MEEIGNRKQITIGIILIFLAVAMFIYMFLQQYKSSVTM